MHFVVWHRGCEKEINADALREMLPETDHIVDGRENIFLIDTQNKYVLMDTIHASHECRWIITPEQFGKSLSSETTATETDNSPLDRNCWKTREERQKP